MTVCIGTLPYWVCYVFIITLLDVYHFIVLLTLTFRMLQQIIMSSPDLGDPFTQIAALDPTIREIMENYLGDGNDPGKLQAIVQEMFNNQQRIFNNLRLE